MFRVSYLDIWWRHNFWIHEKLKFDYLKHEKSFRSAIFPCFTNALFIYTKQISKNSRHNPDVTTTDVTKDFPIIQHMATLGAESLASYKFAKLLHCASINFPDLVKKVFFGSTNFRENRFTVRKHRTQKEKKTLS